MAPKKRSSSFSPSTGVGSRIACAKMDTGWNECQSSFYVSHQNLKQSKLFGISFCSAPII